MIQTSRKVKIDDSAKNMPVIFDKKTTFVLGKVSSTSDKTIKNAENEFFHVKKTRILNEDFLIWFRDNTGYICNQKNLRPQKTLQLVVKTLAERVGGGGGENRSCIKMGYYKPAWAQSREGSSNPTESSRLIWAYWYSITWFCLADEILVFSFSILIGYRKLIGTGRYRSVFGYVLR